MQKIKSFFSRYGMVAFISLSMFSLMNNCSKNSRFEKLEKKKMNLESRLDSVSKLIPTDTNILIIKLESEYRVYNLLNDEISKLDRQEQMMQFQRIHILDAKSKLEKQISELK